MMDFDPQADALSAIEDMLKERRAKRIAGVLDGPSKDGDASGVEDPKAEARDESLGDDKDDVPAAVEIEVKGDTDPDEVAGSEGDGAGADLAKLGVDDKGDEAPEPPDVVKAALAMLKHVKPRG